MAKFRRITGRTARLLRQEKPRGLTAIPARTGTETGFKKIDSIAQGATSTRAAKSITKWSGAKAYYKSWEPDYLKEYDAVYPMDKNLLFRTLSVQTESYKTHRMQQFILDFVGRLEADGQEIAAVRDSHGNIYVVKGVGDLYPTIVAHTDTVHDIVPNADYTVRSNGRYLWAETPDRKPLGIGGDDKVGIFIALSMLRDMPLCKAAFFVDEEVGCKGSRDAVLDFFSNSAFVLQCDRKGNEDFVRSIMGTPLYGQTFSAAVDPILDTFGYSAGPGGMTDVWQLKELGLKVAAANMSCGYFSPHSAWETVGYHDVQRCYDVVVSIFRLLGETQWVHELTPVTNRFEYPYATGMGWNGFDEDWDSWYGGTYYRNGVAVGTDPTTPEWKARDRHLEAQSKRLTDIVRAAQEEKEAQGAFRAAVQHELADAKDLRDWEASQTIIKGTVSLSQLLDEDRARIEAGLLDDDDADWTRRKADLDYPDCPVCKTADTVIYDDGDDMFWCLGCDGPVGATIDFIADDETRMPGGVDLGLA